MVIAGLAAGFAVGGLASLFFPDDGRPIAFATLVALPIPTVWDLTYRWRNHREYGRWRFVRPGLGGSFLFLPVWVWFGAWPVVGVTGWLVGRALGLA